MPITGHIYCTQMKLTEPTVETQKFSYINSLDVDAQIMVEPWAEQFVVRPSQRVDFLISNEGKIGAVELEQLPTGLIIYGYEGCVIKLFSDGRELAPSDQEL